MMPSSVSERAAASPGCRQIGRYILGVELGRGAMGTVYRAEDPLIERKVALKMLAPELLPTGQADFRERFFREAKAAGRLNHPNIVTIYDVGESGEDGAIPYIAMEFLTGLTLRESLDSGVVFPVRKVIEVALLVIRGLDYAHQHGVVHRDIKPGNIMLARNGMVKIMDFGIALAVDAGKTLDQAMFGSPKYMAPEQVANGPVDARTDIFALGVTLYEMLTGKDPFGADSIPAVLHNIVHRDPPSPATLNPDVPPELDRAVMRALAKDPAARFASAREMGRALNPVRRMLKDREAARRIGGTSGPTTAARAPEHAQASPRRSGRMRANYLTAALLAAVAVAAGFGFLFEAREEAAEEAPLAPAAPVAAAPSALPPAPEAPANATTASGGGSAASSDAAESGVPKPDATPTAVAESVVSRVEAERADAPVVKPPATSGAPRATTPAPGKLDLAVSPWGEVRVNGRVRGVTPPLRSLELPPGTYRVEIFNADFAPRVERVKIESGKSFSIRHRFQ